MAEEPLRPHCTLELQLHRGILISLMQGCQVEGQVGVGHISGGGHMQWCADWDSCQAVQCIFTCRGMVVVYERVKLPASGGSGMSQALQCS